MITTQNISGVVVLSVGGNLMRDGSEDFLRKILDLYENNALKIVINLEDCTYITSSNLSVLFQLKKRLIAKGGDLKVARVNTIITKLLERTNLLKVLDCFGTVEQAIGACQADPPVRPA
jgi:anti-anti-sigma factor